jgi:8-oxo-dGTP diphosphatase
MASELERYPRPSVAVDVVVLTVGGGGLEVALYRRGDPPQKGHWALPGGFMHIDESLDAAAARLLSRKVGLAGIFLEQLQAFGALGRDPRGRVVTIAYYALVDAARFAARSPDAVAARVQVGGGGRVQLFDGARRLATFVDHGEIIAAAVARLRERLDTTPVAASLLPRHFTLRQLQAVHEAVRGETLNKDSFRRRVLATGVVQPTGELEREVRFRPAELYRFNRRATS